MVYGEEAIIPLQLKHQAPEIDKVLMLDLAKLKEERLFHIKKLEEDRLNSIHYQEAQKKQPKAWHDINLRSKNISLGDLVLLHDSRIKVKPIKPRNCLVRTLYCRRINHKYLS